MNIKANKLFDKYDLTAIKEICHQMYINEAKPIHIDSSMWLTICWAESVLAIAEDRKLIKFVKE